MPCTYYTEKLINLQELIVKNIVQDQFSATIYAQMPRKPHKCPCSNTLINWQKGILNSFDAPYSNGFTEGCNNKIKVLKRNAYGYRNFERFRKRILHMFSYKNA